MKRSLNKVGVVDFHYKNHSRDGDFSSIGRGVLHKNTYTKSMKIVFLWGDFTPKSPLLGVPREGIGKYCFFASFNFCPYFPITLVGGAGVVRKFTHIHYLNVH